MSESEARSLIQREAFDSGYRLPATEQTRTRLNALIEHTGYEVKYPTERRRGTGVSIKLVPIGEGS